MFDGNFDKVLLQADNKYQSKKDKYGESWKTMDIAQLSERLSQEIQEMYVAIPVGEKYQELLDVINLSLMFAERLRINATMEVSGNSSHN